MKMVLVLAVIVTLAFGCTRREASRSLSDVDSATPAQGEPPAVDAAFPSSGESIYQLNVPLQGPPDVKVGLAAGRGHPVLIAMFYATCRSSCPVIVSAIKRIESQLSASEREDLHVLLVSFDADRDTADVLRQLAIKHDVDAARWRFAAAPEPGARALAAVLGVQYRRMPEGEFSHNAVIALLDRDGAIVQRSEELVPPNAEMVQRTRALSHRE
jgi:protein SCO1/2